MHNALTRWHIQGNTAFKAGDYPKAIGACNIIVLPCYASDESVGFYAEAITLDRTDVTFPLNRAAAYLKLGKYVLSESIATVRMSQRPPQK